MRVRRSERQQHSVCRCRSLVCGSGHYAVCNAGSAEIKSGKASASQREFFKDAAVFCFDENSVTLKLKAGDREEEYEIPYEQIAGIYERKDLFYVYIGKTQALIVPKENLEGGSADDLAQLFRKTGKRFKEKKSLRKKTAV